MLTVPSAFSKASFQSFSGPGCNQKQFRTFIFQQFYALYWGEAKSVTLLTLAMTPSKNVVDDPVWIVCTLVWGKPNTLTPRGGCKRVFDLDYI
jgi:hypothetical protein